MDNLSGKARVVFIMFCCVIVANILWFMFRLTDDTVYEGPEQPDGGYEQIIAQNDDDPSDSKAGSKDDNKEDSKDEDSKKEEGGSNQKAEPVVNDDFYYSQLSSDEQAIYEALLEGVQNREDTFTVDNCTADQLEPVWVAMLMDNVDIFWTNSYHCLAYSGGNPYCEVSPDYIYSAKEIKNRKSEIEDVVNDCLSGISGGASDYEKIQYVYEYIVNETDYDEFADNNQFIDSVFIGKASVCAGYAKSTKYLLNQLGITCYYVAGDTVGDTAGIGHAWNIVECEGDYYYVDSTWGDPLYQSEEKSADNAQEWLEQQGVEDSGKWYDNISNISYDYLNCNDEQLFVTHTLDTEYGYEYPSCTELEWNYYVVNGRYFTSYDAAAVEALIASDIENEEAVSEFKFADQATYEAARNDLINVQLNYGMKKINDTKGITDGACVYKDNPEKLTFIVYWYYGE